MDVGKVGVVGAGTMGNGIAHVFARSGLQVILSDIEPKFLDRAIQTIEKNLEREVAKNKITAADKSAALERIVTTVERAKLAECDFVVEAATEKFEIKAELFRDLDRICRPEVILASNTSSISITKLGALSKRPDKVIGMHFFNPVPVMKLVEVVRGLATSDETFEVVKDLALKLEKTPVEVNDAPGFVSNRVLMPLLNEAMFTVMEGVATPEAVDEVFKLGMAHPMGPLTLADFIGPGRLGDGSASSAYSCHWRAYLPICCWDRSLTMRRFGHPDWALSPESPVLMPERWHEKAWTNCFGRTKGYGFPTEKSRLTKKLLPDSQPLNVCSEHGSFGFGAGQR